MSFAWRCKAVKSNYAHIWVNVFTSGRSKICRRQSLQNLKWYGLCNLFILRFPSFQQYFPTSWISYIFSSHSNIESIFTLFLEVIFFKITVRLKLIETIHSFPKAKIKPVKSTGKTWITYSIKWKLLNWSVVRF